MNLHSIVFLNVKKLLTWSRRHIWSLNDSNGIETHYHLNRKLILNYLAKVAKWLSVRLRTNWLWIWILILSLTYLPVYQKSCFLTATAESDDFNQTSPPGSSKQSLEKSIAKAKRAFPKHTPLKVKVMSNLVTQLSPRSKTSVFSSARRSLNKPCQPRKKTTEVQDRIVRSLEKPDISYCCPGRKDTVYCGESEDRKKPFGLKQKL